MMALLLLLSSLLRATLSEDTADMTLRGLIRDLIVTSSGEYHEEKSTPVWNYDYFSERGFCTCTDTAKCGPSCWASIVSPDNMCNGAKQSPIDLVNPEVDDKLGFPIFSGVEKGCESWAQFATDHSFKVDFEHCDDLSVRYEGTKFTLKQLHFHQESEHRVAGGAYDAEVHLVHMSKSGALMVVGVFLSAVEGSDDKDFVKLRNLFKTEWLNLTKTKTVIQVDLPEWRGSSNTFLSKFWAVGDVWNAFPITDPDPDTDSTPIQNITSYKRTVTSDSALKMEYLAKEFHVNSPIKMNPYTSLLKPGPFYTYSGSLTTYPCTEGVTWVVMEDPMPVSILDLNRLKAAVKGNPNTILEEKDNYFNFRPTQPLVAPNKLRYYPGPSSRNRNPNYNPNAKAEKETATPMEVTTGVMALVALVLVIAMIVTNVSMTLIKGDKKITEGLGLGLGLGPDAERVENGGLEGVTPEMVQL